MVGNTHCSNNFTCCYRDVSRAKYRSSTIYLCALLDMFTQIEIEKKLLSFYSKNINFLTCPKCSKRLLLRDKKLNCTFCPGKYNFSGGVPLLYVLDKKISAKESITETIKSFYEKTPFPNYENIDSSESLRKKATDGVFARLLDEQIPNYAYILEIGCGTGQLSNFLGLTWGRKVFATDISLNSLKLGQEFKLKNEIDNVVFIQMNLFRPCFKTESFDLVICNGVLHHTNNPRIGYKSISGLVKNGGYIVIGLYNKYGRLTTDLRRIIFNITGNSFKFLDPMFRDKTMGNLRKNTWFLDQYKNPHESKHTIDEVMHWFEESGFEFTNSIPEIMSSGESAGHTELFSKNSHGTSMDRFLVQINMLLGGGREGGFFIMIGKKCR